MGVIGSIFVGIALGLSSPALVQQGGNQGPIGAANDGTADSIEQGIERYLDGPETDTIVTPGDPVEYTLNLKAGQVVVGEARSDAFDPALQVVDAAGKVMAANDDRYPGDQRPLLFWRTQADGTYKVRVSSFRDREGGKVFVRFKTYDSFDLTGSDVVEREVDAAKPFLARIPMRRGQVREVRADRAGNAFPLTLSAVIAPGGLPDIGLALRLQPAVYALVAPVDGDYYILHTPHGQPGTRGKVRLAAREIAPLNLQRTGPVAEAKAPTHVAAVAELTVKQGEFLQVATPDLSLESRLVLTEQPDVQRYDLAKPETNPFFPNPREDPGPAFDLLPGRSGDGRLINFRARRDAKLWVATNAVGTPNGTFTLRVRPAARELTDGPALAGDLRIADYDHWTFDAKPGDVMNFDIVAKPFREVTVVRDPDLQEIRHVEMPLDQSRDTWRMIVRKPGRYIVTVSSLGEGGSGPYSISRKAYPPKEFGKGKPARGEISNGEVQVWRMTLAANDPQLLRWKSTNWEYEIAIYSAEGHPTGFQQEPLSPNERVGIVNTPEPRTYVIVLTGRGAKASYSIELGGIPSGR
jgi:hypothetical protein